MINLAGRDILVDIKELVLVERMKENSFGNKYRYFLSLRWSNGNAANIYYGQIDYDEDEPNKSPLDRRETDFNHIKQLLVLED